MSILFFILLVMLTPVFILLGSLMLNYWMYPSKGVVVLEYLNNLPKSIRVKEMIGEGQKLIDIKFGAFYPLGAKYIMPPPDVSSRCITTQGSQFYSFASSKPGKFDFMKFDDKDDTYAAMATNSNAWTIHFAKVRRIKKMVEGDNVLQKNIVLITCFLIMMATMIILTYKTNSIAYSIENILLGGGR